MTSAAQTSQGSLPFPKDIRINGDQFFEDAETCREAVAMLLRKAAILESLAIEAWAKAERSPT
jgi:hypothetical protein